MPHVQTRSSSTVAGGLQAPVRPGCVEAVGPPGGASPVRNPTAIPGKAEAMPHEKAFPRGRVPLMSCVLSCVARLALRLVLRSSKSGRRKSRDCGDAGVAKNVITVGAVNDAVSGGQRDPAAASMSSFSGWGPVDDGRVKPDLVANGVGLYSTDSGNDNDYRTMSDTSMASPNAAGTAALLVDLYRDRSGGSFPLAASLKALLIHTADDLGNPGPDYAHGWGLINAENAADFLIRHFETPSGQYWSTDFLSGSADSRDFVIRWDGVEPLRATLVWTDPAGPEIPGLDNPAPTLVNDLDLRIIGPDGSVFAPFVLDPSKPSLPAVTGDNRVDNVESVILPAGGLAGDYRVRVTHKNNPGMQGQAFSLLIGGQSAGAIAVSPDAAAVFGGPPGGPFSPPSAEYLVSNPEPAEPLVFSVAVDVPWLDVSASGGSIGPGEAPRSVVLALNGQAMALGEGVHTARVTFRDDSGGSELRRSVRIEIAIDPLTEVFSSGFDLSNRSITFIPDGSGGYVATVDTRTAYPTDPGPALANPPDDGSILLSPSWGEGFRFFGQPVGSLHLNTNGNITFSAGDTDWSETGAKHFAMARISALFDDFDPSSGGALRYRHEPGDRVVLTFDGVPEWGSSNASRFQVELFDDGSDIIRLTFLDVAARDGIVGLSAGEGEPTGFAVPGVDFSDDYDPPPLLRATVLEADAGEWEPAENRAVVIFENEYPISIPLSVPILAGGEAGPDDLVALPRSVEWPPFADRVEWILEAVPDDQVEGDESLTLALETAPALYRIGGGPAVLILRDRPVDRWKNAQFGAGGALAADTADPDGDGISNLLEYALGLDPNLSDTSSLPGPRVEGGWLRLPYQPDPAKPDVQVRAKSSTDAVEWTGSDVEWRDGAFETPVDAPAKFLRIEVER